MKLPVPGKSVWISVGIVMVGILLALNYGRTFAPTASLTAKTRGYLGLA